MNYQHHIRLANAILKNVVFFDSRVNVICGLMLPLLEETEKEDTQHITYVDYEDINI